jgi:hypothetical protein
MEWAGRWRLIFKKPAFMDRLAIYAANAFKGFPRKSNLDTLVFSATGED